MRSAKPSPSCLAHPNSKTASLARYRNSARAAGNNQLASEVENLSEKPMEAVKVDFGTFDSTGNLLADTSTFVNAIPPGQSRMSEGYADHYGTEANAKVKIGSIRYSGE